MPTGGERTSLTPSQLISAFDDGSEMFSPGLPPVPVAERPVRRLDFPTGYNQVWTPRAYEPFTFAALRSFSNVELIRLLIETRKDQIGRLDYKIRTIIGKKERADSAERISKCERLLRKPDGETTFDDWTRLLLEDMLSIDAATVERRRNRNGDLIGLDIVDGSTIRLLIDERGRTPKAPLPAYQQVIKGTIWNDLNTRDLIYAPRNKRPGHIYGFGPVEQTIVTINTLIRRQTAQLAYFTDGNVPQGLVAVPDGWTPDQVREYQDWLDSTLSGNLAQRSKMIAAPSAAKYQPIKESPIKDEFDEWLARIACYAFSIPPTPFIKQMNRGTAQEDADRAMEEGLGPLLKSVKRVYDGVIQDDMGFPELEFTWITVRDIDIEKQGRVHDQYLRNGTRSINEIRDDLGLKSIGPDGDKHFIYTGTGAMPIDRVEDSADAQIKAATQPPAGRALSSKTVSRPKATSSSPSPERKAPQTQ